MLFIHLANIIAMQLYSYLAVICSYLSFVACICSMIEEDLMEGQNVLYLVAKKAVNSAKIGEG